MDAHNIDFLASLITQPQQDGSFEESIQKLYRSMGALRKVVFLAFPPKAGGTFLRTALIHAVDGQLVRASHAHGGRDATPYLPTFVSYYMGLITPKTMVTHAHMLALPANVNFLDAFSLHPVIIKRSIPDMLLSYGEMLCTDDVAMREGLNGHIPSDFRKRSAERQADFLIDILAPWYVNYYAGWLDLAEKRPEFVLVADYRDLKTDVARLLQRCLIFSGIACSSKTAEAAVQKAWAERDTCRFNKGLIGRGKTYFSEAQIERLERTMAHYPALDLYRDDLLGRSREA